MIRIMPLAQIWIKQTGSTPIVCLAIAGRQFNVSFEHSLSEPRAIRKQQRLTDAGVLRDHVTRPKVSKVLSFKTRKKTFLNYIK